MNKDLVSHIVNTVLERISNDKQGLVDVPPIPVEVSGRHVHFSPAHFEELFGKGAALENVKNISQPGQFLSSSRVKLIGPKGAIDRVAVLGPLRKSTQIEISLTDAAVLGIDPPIRRSGDTGKSADIHIQAGGKILFAPSSTIVAARHLHMAPRDAVVYGVADGKTVDVLVEGSRSVVLCGVLVRADDTGALGLHIDFDEANAAGVRGSASCRIITGAGAPQKQVEAVPTEEYLLADALGKPVLLTEKMVEKLYRDGVREIRAQGKAIVTALARDALNKRGITFNIT